jgi:hypothetical protein
MNPQMNDIDISNNPNKESNQDLEMKDLTNLAKSAYSVYQGQFDKFPELMNNGKQLINKASRKVGTTPGVLTAGVVAIGAAIFAYNYRMRMNHR